jgi:molecular chaperone GrpE (heat shock protein)
MDPITALGIASTAYKAIVTGFKVGKQVESMSKDLGRWMGAIQDIKDGHKKQSSGKSFGSVEEESLETFAALKKAEQMENDLRSFINFEYGPNAWNEVLRIQADIRLKKKEAIEEAKRKQKQMIENTILGGIALFFIIFVVYIALLVLNT